MMSISNIKQGGLFKSSHILLWPLCDRMFFAMVTTAVSRKTRRSPDLPLKVKQHKDAADRNKKDLVRTRAAKAQLEEGLL